MGGLSIKGYVLEPPRVGSANSPYTQTPNVYISDQSAFDAAYPSDESVPRTEYHVFVLVDGDFPTATFAWTKNEIISRFEYDGQQQRFKTMPGAIPEVVGNLAADSNISRLVVAPPAASDLVSYPVRVSVGSGVGTTFTAILVALDSDLNAPDPPSGSVQVSQQSGKLGWAPTDLTTYLGQEVQFQRQSFYTASESTGALGAIEDTLVISPLPASGQFPLIRIGFAEYLTPVEVVTLGSPAAGTVQWDRATGELRFSASDIAANPGRTVYYDGSCFGFGLTVVTETLGTVSAPGTLWPLPPEDSDLFFRLPSTSPLVQFTQTVFVDALTPAPTLGLRDRVEVKRSDGQVQFSFIDQYAYGSLTVEAVVADLYIERGMTLRMFRTPVDPKAQDDTLKDVTAFHEAQGVTWAKPIIGSPVVSMPALPVESLTFTVEVQQGTGTFPEGVLNRLDVASPTPGYGYVVDYEARQLKYAKRVADQLLSASQAPTGGPPGRRMMLVKGPFGALQLPAPLVFESNLSLKLEDSPGGGTFTDLVLGIDALFDYTSGLITFVATAGVTQTQGTGASFSGTTFTDLDQDFSGAGVQSGDSLFVLPGGPGMSGGVYTIDTVGTNTLSTDLSGGVYSNLSYEIRRGGEVLADRFFKEIPPVDPNTRVERLRNLGPTSNSPRLSVDTAYLDATRFRFGTSDSFSTTVTLVPNSGSFSSPAGMTQGTVEIAEDSGEVNFSQDDVDAALSVYWARTLELGTDYQLQPPLGTVQFTERMLEQEEAYLTYAILDDDGNRIIVHERGTFIVRKEVTADHPSPTGTLSFNPLGRQVADNPAPQAFRGGRPQVTGEQVDFDTAASTVTFIGPRTVTDALPSGPIVGPEERVYIDYWVYDAIGGEKTLAVLQPPMVGGTINIEAEADRFIVLGDQTNIYKANYLLRVDRSEVYLLGSSTYDAGADTTTVVLASPQTFQSDLLNPSLEVTSGATRVNTLLFFPSYFTTEMNTWDVVPRGEARFRVSEDLTRTYTSGTVILFTDGSTFLHFNLVEGSTYDAVTNKTEVVLSSNGVRQYNPLTHTLKHSVRPILAGPSASVTTSKSPLLVQPYLVYRRVEGEAGQVLSQPEDYDISDAGQVSFTDPLQDNEELVILYTGANLIEAGRRIKASYTHAIAPSSDNGLTGQVLKASFTSYIPDTIYWRVETFTNYRAELSQQYEEDAQANIPTGGPILSNASAPQLYEQGRESIFFEEGRLFNEDEVARPTLKYYNDAINYLEDCLQDMDGRVVGDYNGRFLFDGLITNPVRNTYAEVTNQIDDIFKVAEPPLQVTLNPFSFTWLHTYQEAYKAAPYSRFYPTYRALFGVTIAGSSSGDTILDTKYKNFAIMTNISRRLPWSIVRTAAKVGDFTVYVDSTAREDDLFRPAMNPAGHPFTPSPDMLVYIQDRDGTWIRGPADYLEVNSVTAETITFTSPLTVAVPVGATIYHVPAYIPLVIPSPTTPYLKTYRGNFDVTPDLQGGTLQYIEPYFPFDGTISPFPVPTEMTIQPPVQEEILDVYGYLYNTLTEPFRFPALDGGTTDDDGNRSFPMLTPSPESELGSSKVQHGSATPDIGYLSLEDTYDSTIQLITTDGLLTTGSLDVTKLIITKDSGNWPAPVPKTGDLVEIRTGLNGPSGYHWISSATLNTITVSTPFASQDSGFTLAVTVATPLATGAGVLTTTTQLDDAGATFQSNGVLPGHTVVLPALGQRRQVLAVPSEIQLITEPFALVTPVGVAYNVDDSILTYGGTGSLLEYVSGGLDGQLNVLRDNGPPTKPWAEIKALERFLNHVFTDVLTSSNGETTSGVTTLTDSSVNFQTAGVALGQYVFIRAGNSAGIYAVDSVIDPTHLAVDASTPFPDTATGISYRVVSSLGATINTLSAVYNALVNIDQTILEVTAFRNIITTAVTVVSDAGAFARRTLFSDLTARQAEVAARLTQIDPSTGDIAGLEAALTSGDRWYDKRYTWIDARINLEKGILPKKDRAVANRLKAQAEVLKELTKLLTVRPT